MWTDYNENYEVSSKGHIRNKKTKRVLHEFVGKDGYMRTQFGGKTRLVHRVIATVFITNQEKLPEVNHKDGNKQNNSADNFEWVTRSRNQEHAYGLGLKSAKGTKNGRHKLSDNDVDYIRKNYKRGDKDYGAKALAEKFGVARQTISAVVCSQNWR